MGERGFSLVETLIATALLAGALVTLAQFVSAATQSGAAARTRLHTALMAEQKMEQLRALPYSALALLPPAVDYLDAQGNGQCAAATNACGDAVYVRQWSSRPASFSAGVLIIQVEVGLVGKGHGSTTFLTARARNTP